MELVDDWEKQGRESSFENVQTLKCLQVQCILNKSDHIFLTACYWINIILLFE